VCEGRKLKKPACVKNGEKELFDKLKFNAGQETTIMTNQANCKKVKGIIRILGIGYGPHEVKGKKNCSKK